MLFTKRKSRKFLQMLMKLLKMEPQQQINCMMPKRLLDKLQKLQKKVERFQEILRKINEIHNRKNKIKDKVKPKDKVRLKDRDKDKGKGKDKDKVKRRRKLRPLLIKYLPRIRNLSNNKSQPHRKKIRGVVAAL